MIDSGFQTGCMPIDRLSAALVERWKHLHATEPHLVNPFFSYEFAAAVSSVHPRVSVCVIGKRPESAAFLPFQFASPVHQALRAAERVGGELSDAFGIIAPLGFQITTSEILRAANLNHLYFTHLLADQRSQGLDGESPETGLLIDIHPVPGMFWEQLRARDKKFAQDTERRSRKLEAAFGPLRFSFQANDSPAEITRLIEHKRAQYRLTSATDCLAESWRRDLLHKLALRQSNACSAVISTLHAGDTWVASQLSLRSGPVLHNWFPAYNRELASFAPGRLLLKQILDAAPTHLISVIDRGAGDTQAKRDFATREQLMYRGAWYRPGIQRRSHSR